MKRIISLLILLMLTLPALADDLLVKTDHKKKNGKTYTSTLYVTQSHVKMENLDGTENNSVIYHADTEELILLDHKKKEYSRLDKAAVEQLSIQLKKAMDMMEKYLEMMPASQREMVKNSMAGMFNDEENIPPKYEKVKSNVPVGKWNCDHYTVKVAGDLSQELFLASNSDLGIKSSDTEVFKKMLNFLSENFSQISSIIPVSFGYDLNNIGDLPAFKDGFPVKTIEYTKGEVMLESVVKEINRAELEASTFEVPKKYKERTIEVPAFEMSR